MSLKTLNRICVAALAILTALLISGCIAWTTQPAYDYSEVERGFLSRFNNVVLYDASELSGDILRNRGGLIIERCVGVVENENGDGRALNPADPDYDYIGYRDCNVGFSVGDIILTYFVYDPFGKNVDDVLVRYDYNLTSLSAAE